MFAAILLFIATYWRIGALIAFVGAVGAEQIWVYDRGVEHQKVADNAAFVAVQTETNKERDREMTINKAALVKANQDLADQQDLNDKLNQSMSDNDEQIANDRKSIAKCLPSSSLQRLNILTTGSHSSKFKSTAKHPKVPRTGEVTN